MKKLLLFLLPFLAACGSHSAPSASGAAASVAPVGVPRVPPADPLGGRCPVWNGTYVLAGTVEIRIATQVSAGGDEFSYAFDGSTVPVKAGSGARAATGALGEPVEETLTCDRTSVTRVIRSADGTSQKLRYEALSATELRFEATGSAAELNGVYEYR